MTSERAVEAGEAERITYCRTCGKTRMVEWLHRDCEPEPSLAAARGEPPEPEPAIDVERLARAMTTVYEEDLFPIKSGDWHYDASLIAAEYAALRDKP